MDKRSGKSVDNMIGVLSLDLATLEPNKDNALQEPMMMISRLSYVNLPVILSVYVRLDVRVSNWKSSSDTHSIGVYWRRNGTSAS